MSNYEYFKEIFPLVSSFFGILMLSTKNWVYESMYSFKNRQFSQEKGKWRLYLLTGQEVYENWKNHHVHLKIICYF